jgi:hypothetical protein
LNSWFDLVMNSHFPAGFGFFSFAAFTNFCICYTKKFKIYIWNLRYRKIFWSVFHILFENLLFLVFIPGKYVLYILLCA